MHCLIPIVVFVSIILAQMIVSTVFIFKDTDYLKKNFSHEKVYVNLFVKIIIYILLIVVVYMLCNNEMYTVAWIIIGLELAIWIVALVLYLYYKKQVKYYSSEIIKFYQDSDSEPTSASTSAHTKKQ